MKPKKNLAPIVLAIILGGAWFCSDKDAEVNRANAAQVEKQVQQQGELKGFAWVDAIGDVSFVVPSGWKAYQVLNRNE